MLPTRHWPSKKCLYHDIFVPSLNFSRVFHSRSTEISFSLSYATGSINVCVWNMPYVPGNRWYFEKPRFVFISFFHFKVRCNRSILFLFENLLCCKAYYSRNRQMLSSFRIVDRVVEQVLHMELQDFQIYSVSWMTNTFLWLSVFFFELVRFFFLTYLCEIAKLYDKIRVEDETSMKTPITFGITVFHKSLQNFDLHARTFYFYGV